MVKIINKLDNIDLLFDKGQFNIEKWTLYINGIYEDSDYIFKQEVDKYTKIINIGGRMTSYQLLIMYITTKI